MNKIFSFIFILFISFQLSAQDSLNDLLQTYNTRSVPYISVQELKMKKDQVVLLDTREMEEFETSHIATAKHVGFNEFSSAKISEEIKDKSTPIVVYCSLGIRSEEIGEKLKKAGYTNVKNLYGGIFEWKNKGFAVLDKKQKETDSIHTFSKAWSKWLIKGIGTY